MLIVMRARASRREIDGVCRAVRGMGLTPHPIPGSVRTAIGVTGNKEAVEAGTIEALPGVARVIRVTQPYKLVGREMKPENTVVDLGDGVEIGGPTFAVIAGPCAIESREQALTIARAVKKAGACAFRGGAYKPRTSPYSFQGLGPDALEILSEVRAETGLRIVTEAVDPDGVDLVEEVADVIQIGARNMQNYSLLKRVGRSKKAVLLKRGMSSTLDDLLLAAEYILSEGNYGVILCERGVRTFADHTRNTLDLSVVPAVRQLSHLPILVDPSHGTGRRDFVAPLARAAMAVGADGIIVEVHHDPDHALSDGPQSIVPATFAKLMAELRKLAPLVGRTLS